MSLVAPVPTSPRSFLAFDFGTKRVGVASGNTITRTATPLKTVAAEGDARFAALGALIAEWKPDALVVGVPYHPDGAPHDNTARAQRFLDELLEIAIRPEFVYKHEYKLGDMLIIDNRSAMHKAGYHEDQSQHAMLYRILVRGDRPY